VVINLLDNAIKFTPGGGDIRVTTMNKGAVVEIAVSDNGVGIPAGKQPTIFEEFEQAETHQGTGLGLAIAKKIVEMHQGLIELKSVEGSGSTFTVILPVGGVVDNKDRN
jgi:signal transduction histidine kinase